MGAGRHALALQALGKDVIGLDPWPGAVEVARQRGVDARLGSLGRPPAGLGRFDTLLLLGNNLGLLQSRQQAPIVLEQLASLARPGARLLGTSTDPCSNDPDHIAHQDYNSKQGRLPGQIRIRVRNSTLATAWFNYLLLSLDELQQLLHQAPWRMGTVQGQGCTYLAELCLEGR